MDQVVEDRIKAIKRHDIDSGIFQGRYVNFNLGKYTDPFIYGRYQLFEEVVEDLDKLPRGAKVLDLGAGTGHLSDFIHKKGFEVVGVEPSPEMLKLARDNFKDITFADGISVKIPYPDNSFDYVVSIEVLRYLNPEDVAKTYNEVCRVLKPGGVFHVTHVNRYALDFYFFFYYIDRFFKRMGGQKFYHYGYFTTPGREERLAVKGGFSKSSSVGRLFAPVRIFYKFGNTIGRGLTKFIEIFGSKQHYPNNPLKSVAGHLIIRCYK
jgi:ubiquinone/menaquinone biosynthesis C-methylase UbiE